MLVSLLLFLISSSPAQDAPGFTSVSGFEDSTPEALLFMSDGRVGRLPSSSIFFKQIKSGLRNNLGVQALVDPSGKVNQVKIALQSHKDPFHVPFSGPKNIPDFELPSILTPDQAEKVFHSMNPNYRRRSQCFNRAHVWTYETFTSKQIRLMKVFMFFTARYIRDYHYGWWFHVSPFSYVNDNGTVRESILDFRFMQGPASPREWSDHFIEPKSECPTVKKYSDYSNHQYEHYCYFMKVPMYFWQPRHLEALETGALPPETFIRDEVLSAYSQGFFGGPLPNRLQAP